MIAKYIQHLIAVSMKHFFNIDLTILTEVLAVVFVALAFSQILWYKTIEELRNGLLTVHSDLSNAKQEIHQFKQNLPAKEIVQHLFMSA